MSYSSNKQIKIRLNKLTPPSYTRLCTTDQREPEWTRLKRVSFYFDLDQKQQTFKPRFLPSTINKIF